MTVLALTNRGTQRSKAQSSQYIRTENKPDDTGTQPADPAKTEQSEAQ